MSKIQRNLRKRHRHADCVVVGLKSRSCPVQEAVDLSLSAYKWLDNLRAEYVYFKYCSTFDSTADGNIGPVLEALREAMGESQTFLCPALPVNQRSVYKGYLFIGSCSKATLEQIYEYKKLAPGFLRKLSKNIPPIKDFLFLIFPRCRPLRQINGILK